VWRSDILQDGKNDLRFFHQLGLLPAYLHVAFKQKDDTHNPGGYIEFHRGAGNTRKIDYQLKDIYN